MGGWRTGVGEGGEGGRKCEWEGDGVELKLAKWNANRLGKGNIKIKEREDSRRQEQAKRGVAEGCKHGGRGVKLV